MGAATSPVRISGPLMSIMIAMSRPTRWLTARMRRMMVAGPLVRGMGHVEADDVGARADDLLEHLLALGGGTEREDDFGAADE